MALSLSPLLGAILVLDENAINPIIIFFFEKEKEKLFGPHYLIYLFMKVYCKSNFNYICKLQTFFFSLLICASNNNICPYFITRFELNFQFYP